MFFFKFKCIIRHKEKKFSLLCFAQNSPEFRDCTYLYFCSGFMIPGRRILCRAFGCTLLYSLLRTMTISRSAQVKLSKRTPSQMTPYFRDNFEFQSLFLNREKVTFSIPQEISMTEIHKYIQWFMIVDWNIEHFLPPLAIHAKLPMTCSTSIYYV